MGLDMYLSGEIYLVTDWENPKNNLTEDGYRVKGRELEIGYWRKHPDLHGYIVHRFADGEDRCQRIDLSPSDIGEIITAIQSNLLPKTNGFFFGESENDTGQKNEAITIFQKALKWLTTPVEGQWRSVAYQASW